MLFTDKSRDKPQRVNPFSVSRPIIVYVCLLALLILLGFQYYTSVNRDWKDVPGVQGGEGILGKRPPEGGEKAGDGTPLSIGTPLEPQPPETFVARPEILAGAASKDRTGEFDEAAIAYLFQKIRTEGEAFHQAKPQLRLGAGDKVSEALTGNPDAYRGALVEIAGQIVAAGGELPLRLFGLDYPNPSGLDRAYESCVWGTDDKIYLVATLRRQVDLGHRDAVRLRAYFCNLYTYKIDLKGQSRLATIPFLVGDDYELLERPTTGATSLFTVLAIVVAGTLAVAAVLLYQRGSRKKFEARRRGARSFGAQLHSGGLSPDGHGEPAPKV